MKINTVIRIRLIHSLLNLYDYYLRLIKMIIILIYYRNICIEKTLIVKPDRLNIFYFYLSNFILFTPSQWLFEILFVLRSRHE